MDKKKSVAEQIVDDIEEDIKNSRGLDFAWDKISPQYKRRLRYKWRNIIQTKMDEIRSMF